MGEHALTSDPHPLFQHYRAKSPDREDHVHTLPFEKGDSVLDIGSGPGYYASLIAKKVGQTGKIDCLDPDPRNVACIQSLKNFTPGGEIIMPHEEKIENISIEDGYDVVFISNFLMACEDAWAKLAKAVRCLRPGGRLILCEQDSGSVILHPVPMALHYRLILARVEAREGAGLPVFDGFLPRWAPSYLQAFGARTTKFLPKAIAMAAPLEPDERSFLQNSAVTIAQQAEGVADPADLAAYKSYFDPHQSMYLLDRPDFYYCQTQLAFVAYF